MRFNAMQERFALGMKSMSAIPDLINADRARRRLLVEAFAEAGDPLTVQAINDWKNLKHGVPPSRVTIVSRIYGIPRYRIRPDIFPPPRQRRKRKVNGS